MLIETVKKRMFAAMKAGNSVEKEILRTVIGEVTATGEEASDERVVAVIRKMSKSNNETLEVTEDAERRDVLQAELRLLSEFVPSTWSVSQIAEALAAVADAIKSAPSDGPATGVAMKHLKSQGAPVEGKAVKQAVAQLRS